MAKIAFNYLAHVAGASFVLKEEFDGVRGFILHGAGRGSDFVRPVKEALFHEEQVSGPYSLTDDHLVAVDRGVAGHLFGHVSLFNMIHNVVVLCPRNPEVIELGDIPSGRRFSWRDGTILSIRGWERDNLVQPFEVLLRERRRSR
jgi:hypothetical protein